MMLLGEVMKGKVVHGCIRDGFDYIKLGSKLMIGYLNKNGEPKKIEGRIYKEESCIYQVDINNSSLLLSGEDNMDYICDSIIQMFGEDVN